jgi:hypothetical protein
MICSTSATGHTKSVRQFLFLARLSHLCERFLDPNHTFASADGRRFRHQLLRATALLPRLADPCPNYEDEVFGPGSPSIQPVPA